MDNQQSVQEAEDQQPLTTRGQNFVIAIPVNPDSWFRKRLDHVRGETRKGFQFKSIRPQEEK
jgi:hypothetical protein